MGKHEMAEQWEKERGYVVSRMDRFDRRFDKFENTLALQSQEINDLRTKTSKEIESLKLEVLKIASGMTAFKGEFRYKTGAWAFLGTAVALTGFAIYQLIKTQLV